MKRILNNLYITYSNQRARDIKLNSMSNPLDKVITLDSLILELYERKNFQIIIDEMIASSIIYNIIQTHNIEYFSYLNEDAVSLQTIYSFILKCNRNNITYKTLLKGKKLNAISTISQIYQEYKQRHNLVDLADIEKSVFENWNSDFFNKYENIYLDEFKVGNINFKQSAYQEKILENFSHYKTIVKTRDENNNIKIIKPSNKVFDTIDEVKTAIKIARKLLQEGEDADEILIVASDIQEYAPLYQLFLDEYEMKGYSSIGTPLSSFRNDENIQVKQALNEYKLQIKSLSKLYKKLNLTLSETTKANLKAKITIADEKVGIELTEPNQLVGLNKRYIHIIFIGTDINHFPPKASDNFLYSYDDDIKYFRANNYFTSSQTQYNELKRLCDNLYLITASYCGKRELTPSTIIDTIFDETIDISSIKGLSELALERKTVIFNENDKKYYESIISEEFTPFDGNKVEGIGAAHLSASQINKYLSCPLAYFYTNKLRIQAPNQEEEGFDVMEQGSLMHLCFQLFGEHIKDNQLTCKKKDRLYEIMYKQSIQAYQMQNSEEFVENIHHRIFLSTLQAGLQDEREPGVLAKFVDYYIENAKEFEYFSNSEFEKEFALDNDLKPYIPQDKNDTNYFIKGFIDRFDNLKNHINIIDYKSKKMKANVDRKKIQEITELQDVQLALYMLYALQQHKNKTCYASLLSFKGDRTYYYFANMSSKEEDKATVLYDEAYEEKLKEVIFTTKEDIENGNFHFNNSDEQACEWCDIKNICHQSVLNKNKNKKEMGR